MQHSQLPDLKEIRTHGTKSFPCAVYQSRSIEKGTFVKHHWHNELEILYFSGEDFQLEINMEPFFVHSECLYFINPGELHSIAAEKSCSSGEDAVVFSADILSFDSCDAAQMQLIQPIKNGNVRFPRCLTPEHAAFAPIHAAFMDIMNVMNTFGRPVKAESLTINTAVTDDPACQLYIKSALLRILAVLADFRLLIPAEKSYNKRVERFKTALTYIREHYKEKIYIKDLAGLMNMNEQYFCRFFKKAVGRTPMEYVNEYRIKQAMRLLEETDLTVMEVCLESGYNNLGNFLREFKKHTASTPLQYRKKS